MAESTQLGIQPVATVGFAAIAAAAGAYILVGRSEFATRMFTIQNFTDVPVMWSFDGVNDNIPLLSNAYFTLDICTNQDLNQGLFLDIDRDIYVRYLTGAPTSGAVYFTAFYAVDYPPNDFNM